MTTNPSSRRLTIPLVALLATVGISLSACGGDDDAAADEPAATVAAPTSAAPTSLAPDPAATDTNPPATPSAPAASAAPEASEAAPAGSLAPEEQMLAYSQCMRDNGITNYPDPAADGSMSVDASTLGVDPADPLYKAAEDACVDLLPPPPDQAEIAQHMDEMLAYSQCMRDEGIAEFPDPSADGGIALNGNVVPIDSPQFKAAEEACQDMLPGGGAGASNQRSDG